MCVKNYGFNKFTIGMKLPKYNLSYKTWDLIELIGDRMMKINHYREKSYREELISNSDMLLYEGGHVPACIPFKTHAGVTPVAPQVYAKVTGWRCKEYLITPVHQ